MNNFCGTRNVLSSVYNARHVANIGSRATALRVGLYLSTQCRGNPRGVFFKVFQDFSEFSVKTIDFLVFSHMFLHFL